MIYPKIQAGASFVFVVCLAAACGLVAQSPSPPTRVLDNSALHPPVGANVAIVEFSDLECPACAHANPTLKEAAARYKIPWVRRDFVIAAHPWSQSAAVFARWFDAKGGGLGDAYRDAVFANQPSIYNVNVLNEFTQNFARSHNVTLPFSIDPQNKLAGAVQADCALGKRTGIVHTPTVFIVTAHSRGAQYIEVRDIDHDLYRTIDQALDDTKGAAAQSTKSAATARHVAKK